MLISNRRTVSADGGFNDLNKDLLFKSSRVFFEIYTNCDLQIQIKIIKSTQTIKPFHYLTY